MNDSTAQSGVSTYVEGAKKDPELQRCLSLLDKSLVQLDDVTGTLIARLSPVSLPEESTGPSAELASIEEPASPLSIELRRLTRRVNAIQSAVGSALSRIEI